MTINDILREHGLSQTELSRRLGIPLRTVQDWAGEKRTTSDWVLNLIGSYLKMEMELKMNEIIMKLAPSADARKALEIILDGMFDGDVESMSRAVDNGELTVNAEVNGGAEWVDYLELSESPREMAVRLEDCKIVKNPDEIAALFGWN